jgi:hypothetical protein
MECLGLHAALAALAEVDANTRAIFSDLRKL